MFECLGYLGLIYFSKFCFLWWFLRRCCKLVCYCCYYDGSLAVYSCEVFRLLLIGSCKDFVLLFLVIACAKVFRTTTGSFIPSFWSLYELYGYKAYEEATLLAEAFATFNCFSYFWLHNFSATFIVLIEELLFNLCKVGLCFTIIFYEEFVLLACSKVVKEMSWYTFNFSSLFSMDRVLSILSILGISCLDLGLSGISSALSRLLADWDDWGSTWWIFSRLLLLIAKTAVWTRSKSFFASELKLF